MWGTSSFGIVLHLVSSLLSTLSKHFQICSCFFHLFCFGCPWFIHNITAQQKAPSGSTWCFEIDPKCGLSDLQVGQTAKGQGLQLSLRVGMDFSDLLLRG